MSGLWMGGFDRFTIDAVLRGVTLYLVWVNVFVKHLTENGSEAKK